MRILVLIMAFGITLAGSGVAHAHSTGDVGGGLVSGFLHPILGLDHLVAMVAVGLWGAQLGRPLIIVLPIVFPVVMALGGVMGIVGVPLPSVEVGIALSALLLGLAVALAFRAPIWLAVVVVGVFAIFHGHAHGQEAPEAVEPFAYGAGFVVSTGLLHAAGIAIGLLNDWRETGPKVVRTCGGVVAAVGAYALVNAVALAAS